MYATIPGPSFRASCRVEDECFRSASAARPGVPEGRLVMSDQDARILASLHDAELDPVQWPATSALIDEACGIEGADFL